MSKYSIIKNTPIPAPSQHTTGLRAELRTLSVGDCMHVHDKATTAVRTAAAALKPMKFIVRKHHEAGCNAWRAA